MGPGKVTTEAGGWITTVESGHCRTQGSLAVSASGAGAATPQGETHRLEQDIFQADSGNPGKHTCDQGRVRGSGCVEGCRERCPRIFQELDLPG